jgi:hypothetical protein
LAAAAAAAALLPALGGCIRVDAEFTFAADDTFSAEVFYGVADQLIEEDPEGVALAQLLIEVQAQTGALFGEADIAEHASGGHTGYLAFAEDVPLADLAGQFGDGTLAVSHEGGLFKLAGEVDLTTLKAAAELAGGGGATVKLRFTFPGKVTRTNGTAQGRTATFDLTPGVNNHIEVVARDDPRPWLLYVIVGGATLLGAGVAAALLMLRRNRGLGPLLSGGWPGGIVRRVEDVLRRRHA